MTIGHQLPVRGLFVTVCFCLVCRLF